MIPIIKIRQIIFSVGMIVLLTLISFSTAGHNHNAHGHVHENCQACIFSINYHAPDFPAQTIFNPGNLYAQIVNFNFEEKIYTENTLSFYLNKAPPAC